ncbi:hypothetical protein [Novosphingobium album (ex Hu et al. 2023)]|nr:hypothetical protein [Novosphingobium album (ex Hu et al. 2023)]
MMPTDKPLNFYLDLRRRLLAGEFAAEKRLVTKQFSAESGLSNSAILGVLNALATDGYLRKQHKSFSPVLWTPCMIEAGVDRLEIFVEICCTRLLRESGHRLAKFVQLAGEMNAWAFSDERYYLKSMECLAVLFGAGERRTIGEVANRLLPQAFFRILWNLLADAGGLLWLRELRSASGFCLPDGRLDLIAIWLSVRASITEVLLGGEEIILDRSRIADHNRVREADLRARTLPLVHLAHPIMLPLVETGDAAQAYVVSASV